MSDMYIYPQCPECGQKGEGVSLRKMPEFVWSCLECKMKFRGRFVVKIGEVIWLERSEMGIFDRIWVRIFK